MRLTIFAVIATVLAIGCTANQNKVTDLNTSLDVIRITPVPEITDREFGHTAVTGAANMLSKIREACRVDGHFWLKHKDQYEKYLCFPIEQGDTHVES